MMRRSTIAALAVSVALIAASCGDSKTTTSEGGGGGNGSTPASTVECKTLSYEDAPEGGEFVDYAQLASGGDNTTFDPSAVQTLDEAQITYSLWDGLTEYDFTDTCKPVLKPLVAEKIESNDDASVWTFTLKKDLKFDDGSPVLPSNFKRAWERMGSAEFASPYGYLAAYIEGGDALQDGSATDLPGVVADDDALTLEVTLSSPNADFDGIVSHTSFMPIATADLDRLGFAPAGWGTEGATIGNGPFKFVSADAPDSGKVVIERSDTWAGNVLGDTKAKLDKITFMITQDTKASYQAFESGEGDNATIPSGRTGEATAKYKNTTKEPTLGSYFYDMGYENPNIGGEKNLKLRQAISLAVDREEINTKVYDGVRNIPTGITPPGIPGFKADLCKYCKTNKDEAKKLYDEWVADGGKLDAPLKLSFNSGGGHEDVMQILQANLKDTLGIETELNSIETGYFREIAKEGACEICRSGWYADYPTYGNWMVDLFGAVSIGGNNLGRYDDPEFETLIADAQKETDVSKRGELYNKAEERLLNETTAVIPLNWYVGDHVFRDNIVNYIQPPLGIVQWEKVGKKS